ncbi:PfkB family carbohydrate kinase [Nesterenkonia muleiensis]|uniref:PfkB family carbohydrate kinase n=1 Tax=Nesterenkonia muleiensis TaxID=2282648 RepID=UPI001EE3DBF7|nr:PfkB family carbohydrate kinase [Nesterenkonia muleiensis]
MGPALVTVTRGASGTRALARSGFVEQKAFPMEGADTVGAGDLFLATTLSNLRERSLLGSDAPGTLRDMSERDVAEVLYTAAQAAASTSSRFGAQPSTAEELSAALAQPAALRS